MWWYQINMKLLKPNYEYKIWLVWLDGLEFRVGSNLSIFKKSQIEYGSFHDSSLKDPICILNIKIKILFELTTFGLHIINFRE